MIETTTRGHVLEITLNRPEAMNALSPEMTRDLTDALVAFELSSTLVTVVLVLLAEGFHRASYFVVPLALAALSFVGALVFVRLLGDRWL